jgi:hypothetical protein
VAIGTIGAVVYALFRDVFLIPRRRPKLDLRFDHVGNDQVIVGTAPGFEAAYVRLRVANRAGKDTADDVVVMVTEVRRVPDSEEATAEVRPIGLPLAWSGTSPPLTVASVHPGSQRHVDLLHVDWPARDEVEIARKWSETVPLQLDLTPNPWAARRSSIQARTRSRSRFAPGTPTSSATASRSPGMASGRARLRCGITSASRAHGRFVDHCGHEADARETR